MGGEVILPLLFFWRCLCRLFLLKKVLIPFFNPLVNSQLKPTGLGLFLVGSPKIINSISSLASGLLKFSVSTKSVLVVFLFVFLGIHPFYLLT